MAEPRARKPRPPMVDFDSLESETFDAKVNSARLKSVDKAPKILAWYEESQRTGNGRRFLVPTVNAKQTENLIRAAARRLGGGAQVGVENLPGGMSRISFNATAGRTPSGKPRKPKAIKRKVGESPSDWRKRQAEWNDKMNAWRQAQPDGA